MEKKLEMMELQYDLSEVSDCPQDFVGVIDAILDFGTVKDEIKKDLIREKKLNSSAEKICSALKGFSSFFGYRNLDYYQDDNVYLLEQEGYVSKYEQCLNRMIGAIDDENYADVYKLALFSHGKFLDNISNVDNKRENLDSEFTGGMMRDACSGDFDVFLTFFDKTLEKIEFVIKPVYEKK